MDRKSIIVIAACVGLMVLWPTVLVPKFFTKPVPPGATNEISTTPTGADTLSPAAPRTAINDPSSAVPTTTTDVTQPAQPEELLEVEHNDVLYIFTSHGGGLKQIDLLSYPQSSAAGKKNSGTNGVVSLNSGVGTPVLNLIGDASVAGHEYSLTRTVDGIRAEATLPSGLTVVKDYQFASNYVFTAQIRYENRSGQLLTIPVHEVAVGASTPMDRFDNGQEMGVLWFNGEKSKDIKGSWFANRTLGCFPGTPRDEFRGGADNVAWTAVHNQFFALAAIPETNAASLRIHKELLPKPTAQEIASSRRINKNPEAYLASLVQPGQTLQPGASATQSYRFYAGPKEYRRLARLSEEFGNDLDLVMGYSGFFGFFSKGLLLGMNLVHDTFGVGYGVAIIVITVIIKLLFWPLTQASTRSMKRMQALQPQMKALQAKFKDDPAKMNKKLMAFMRENKVSPLGGCLPMLLQIPVFFGFFRMIRNAIELRGASFLWINDLSQADTLFMIPGINFPFNLLPLIMGATMLFQARLTPMSPGMDPTQQKMMRYMPLMFMVFLYNYSSGLTLYWTVQNLLTIVQTKLTKMKDPVKPAPASAPAPATTPANRPMKRKRK